tara:strand:+ start:7283 stop:7864 length:582 start_codon:yes stop_codon:yes gene_type:complete
VREPLFIQQLRKGNREAFNQLVEEHKDGVLNICYGFVKNTEEAEDITQEVFVEVFKTISKFREDSSLFTWIYRIAVSRSLDAIKKKKSIKRAAFFEKRVQSEVAEYEIENTASDTLSPDSELEQIQQQQFIQFSLAKLTESQRTAFVLSHQDGLSYKEISEIMGKSLTSIESLIHRSKQTLRKIMEENYREYF